MVDKMSELLVFPFSAIVGQEKAKLALLCNAINPAIGGVLLSGDKGCGKSTMVRALADVLPEIKVVKGCMFNCNPENEVEMCEYCRERAKKGEIEVELIKMRVVDLPLSVTVDRLVGSVDIEKALKEGVRAIQPGILAQANRNILYIDEVNLLDDYVADVLLDSAAMGWNFVEREGISLKHPARFVLVGSMNPEEGELRPQILDRFGLYVQVEAVDDVEQRMEILGRVEEFQSDPQGFRKRFESEQRRIRESVARAREILNRVEIDEDLLKFLVKTIVDLGIKTHRAEIVCLRTAKAIAAFEGRKKVTFEDVKRAMELALPHRTKSKPFEDIKPPYGSEKRDGREGKDENENKSKSKKNESESKNNLKSKNSTGKNRKSKQGEKSESETGMNSRKPDDREETVKISDLPGKCSYGKAHLRGSRGERVSSTEGFGVHVYSIPGRGGEIDVFGSLKNALLRNPESWEVTERDLLVKVKRVRVPRLTAVVLDASGSMFVRRRLSVAKAIARSLVENGYVKRDLLSLTVFRNTSARTVVSPTKRYSAIFKALDEVEFGGKTPLTLALREIRRLAKAFRAKNKNSVVKAVLITDGKANVPVRRGTGSIREEIAEELERLIRENVKLEVYDTRRGFDPTPSFTEMMEKAGFKVWRV